MKLMMIIIIRVVNESFHIFFITHISSRFISSLSALSACVYVTRLVLLTCIMIVITFDFNNADIEK